MKRVLLTGASGFVGRQCLSALTGRGYEVHAVTRNSNIEAPAGGEIHEYHADLLEQQQTTELLRQVKPTHLLHCAWYAVPGKYWEAPENQQWVDASEHLFRTFAEVGGTRAVGVGTCAEYDWATGRCAEFSTPLYPTTTYGSCKLRVGSFLSELGKQTELQTAWGRLFFLYGPHEDRTRLVASVINSLLRNEPALCTHGNQMRDFLHVQDAADSLVALLDSKVSGAVNIASGTDVSVRDVVLEIANQLNRVDLLQLGARPAAPTEPAKILADVTRLRNEVRWRPQYDLGAGVAATIAWWQTQQPK